jgi:shikimate kinase
MGTGKSTIGRIVATVLSMPFIDTDEAIEEMAGERIAEIWAKSGEAVFRKLESVVCLEAAIYGGHVISTGGGALINEGTREALVGSGLIICLDASLEEIMWRIGSADDRPLARDKDRLTALYEARKPVYDSLPIHVDTTGKEREDVAAEVIALWQLYQES